jgi:hypothetical protein
MNIIKVVLLIMICIHVINVYIPKCSAGGIEYRYIPRTLQHYHNDASLSTQDAIQTMTSSSGGNIWLQYNQIDTNKNT